MSTLTVENACFSYDGKTEIFSGLSFSMENKEVLCILGPNGIGKTTLLKSLMNLHPLKSGVIRVDGMARCGRGYGRTYAAAMTNVEYAVMQLMDATPELNANERLLAVTGALLQAAGVTEEGKKALANLI